MSGAQLTIELRGFDAVQKRMDRLAGINTHELLDTVGGLVESQTRRRISQEKTSPGGEKWPGWSDQYAAARHGGHSLLENDGDLLGSIDHQVSGNSVEIGSNLIYGASHQFGDPERGIPAREFLGLSPENETDIEDEIDRWFEEVLQ